jgi:hypothetical protein
VLRRRIGSAIILVLLAGVAIWVNHAIFQREPVFSKDNTGILVMRMEGDDAFNSLQGGLVDNLNVELQNDPTGKKIELALGEREIEIEGLLVTLTPCVRRQQRLGQHKIIAGRSVRYRGPSLHSGDN